MAVSLCTSNGIGAEVSRVFFREGYHVVLADLAADKAAALAAEVTAEYGVKAIAVSCDVARKEELQRVLDACVNAFGTWILW